MALDGAAFRRLQEALISAFPTRSALAEMVRVGLDENLEALAALTNLRSTSFELLVWAEAHGKTSALLAAAREANPGNAVLRALADEASGARAPAPFFVPFLSNPSFVGRDGELTALHALLREEAAIGVGAVAGMGGIGKTQLAVEYAFRYQAAYPGGIFWVNAARSWEAELAGLAEKVGCARTRRGRVSGNGGSPPASCAIWGIAPGHW